jgi:hypothetical protein
MNNRININRKPKGYIIFLSWLFLVILPVFIFDFALNNLLEITEQTNLKLSQEELITEMHRFKSEMSLSNFLDRKLNSFHQRKGKSILKQKAEKVAHLISKDRGFKVAGCVIHGPDTAKIKSIFLSEFLEKKLKSLPRLFTLRFIASINNQPDRKFVNSANRYKFKEFTDEKGKNKLKKMGESFFQKTFGLIAPIPFNIEKTAVSVSAKLNGFIYFYYKPFFADMSKDSAIVGGCFVIVHGKDISLKRVLKYGINQNSTDLKRGLAYYNKPIDLSKKLKADKITSFIQDKNGLHLLSPFTQNLIVHAVQRGQFNPEYLNDFSLRMPLLKVSKQAKLIEHPLKTHYQKIKLLEIAFLLLASILALRIFLFGIDFKLGIRQKSILAITIVALLPLSILFLSFSTHSNFAEKSKQIEKKNELNQKLENIKKGFNNFIEESQLNCFILARQLKTAKETQFKTIINKWFKSSIVQEAILYFPDSPTQSYINKNVPFAPLSRQEKTVRSVFLRGISNSLNSLETQALPKSRIFKNDYYGEILFVQPKFIKNLFMASGRQMEIKSAMNHYKYSILPVTDEKQKLKFVLGLRHNSDLITKKILETNKTILENGSTKIALFRHKKEQNKVKISFVAGNKQKYFKEKVKSACNINNSISWFQPVNDRIHICTVKLLNDLPLAIAASEILPVNANITDNNLILLGLLYFTLFLLLVFKITGNIYLEPIIDLAQKATEIKNNKLNLLKKNYNNFEFNQLKQGFNKMIKGVEQKEKLESFVSKDVKQTVNKNTSVELKPGGEKINATVFFASIENFNQKLKNLPPKNLFRY